MSAFEAGDFKDIRQASFYENPSVINGDEVERSGKDITDTLVGEGLKQEGSTLEAPKGKHAVALLQRGGYVLAVDISDRARRNDFFSHMQEDKSRGIANKYRIFELTEEQFKACVVE